MCVCVFVVVRTNRTGIHPMAERRARKTIMQEGTPLVVYPELVDGEGPPILGLGGGTRG